jgi:hypothetical protein
MAPSTIQKFRIISLASGGLSCGNLFNFSSLEYLLQLSIFRYLTFCNDEFDSDSG